MTGHRYWAMRTDQARRAFIWRELQAGRMRQGWGIRPDDNLENLQRIRRTGGRLDDFRREVCGATAACCRPSLTRCRSATSSCSPTCRGTALVTARVGPDSTARPLPARPFRADRDGAACRS